MTPSSEVPRRRRSAESGAVLWEPDSAAREEANVTAFMRWLLARGTVDVRTYEELWRWSVDDLDGFWRSVWTYYDVGPEPAPIPRQLAETSPDQARWFAGETVNYAEQILRRAPRDRPAIIFVDEGAEPVEMATEQLRGEVGALAAALRSHGVVPGDTVAAYLPNGPEAVVALLAVTSMGATWTICSPDFGPDGVLARFGQLAPKVLIAADGYRFNGRTHDRRDVVARLRDGLPTVEHTILVESGHLDGEGPRSGVSDYRRLVSEWRAPEFEQVDFMHPLWVLFSSGTSGPPKGIVHGHGGIVLEHLKALGLCMDIGPSDRWLFHSSTSWMAWNWLVGGLMQGATIVLYNGSPGFPDTLGLWRVAHRTSATVLGMGAAYAAACESAGARVAELGSTLRIVNAAGSPVSEASWAWLRTELGPDVQLDSTCGGTEVCTAFLGGSRILAAPHGAITCAWLGVLAEAYDENGHPVVDHTGEFVISRPMPSMPIALVGDEGGHRYRKEYLARFPDRWSQGDWVTVRSDGAVTVWGRSDATLNRGGVRLGSAEIYMVLDQFPEISDSLVVGVELPDGGYHMPLFVTVADPSIQDQLSDDIRAALRARLTPRHVPDEIVVVPDLPRTLTGKRLEIPIKRVLQGLPIADVVALDAVDRPSSIVWFEEFGRRMRQERGLG